MPILVFFRYAFTIIDSTPCGVLCGLWWIPEDAPSPRRPASLDRTAVALQRKVGEGAFGEVWQGVIATTTPTKVAVKMIKPGADESAVRELLDEAALMAEIGPHPNLAGLVGVVHDGRGPVMVALAFCDHGSLLDLLRLLPDPRLVHPDPAGTERLRAALDIASGMAFLGSHRGAVHRDLAARNVLVDTGSGTGEGVVRTYKVCDFGLGRAMAVSRGIAADMSSESGPSDETKNYYYYSRAGYFAIRWTALEAMANKRFTAASDVWSFGVTLAEMYNAGDTPYDGLSVTEIPAHLTAGRRMSRPNWCPDAVWEVVSRCWDHDPAKRPKFAELVEFFAAEAAGPPQTGVPMAAEARAVDSSGIRISSGAGSPEDFVTGLGSTGYTLFGTGAEPDIAVNTSLSSDARASTAATAVSTAGSALLTIGMAAVTDERPSPVSPPGPVTGPPAVGNGLVGKGTFGDRASDGCAGIAKKGHTSAPRAIMSDKAARANAV